MKHKISILQVSPTGYSKSSVIGGGGKYVLYVDHLTFRKDLNDLELRALINRAGLFMHASTHFNYQGRYHHRPELIRLAPLEALSTELRTLVSDAGALPELARLPGCSCFQNTTELSGLLQDYLGGALPDPSPHDMHAAVIEHYNLLQFGEKLLKVMGAC